MGNDQMSCAGVALVIPGNSTQQPNNSTESTVPPHWVFTQVDRPELPKTQAQDSAAFDPAAADHGLRQLALVAEDRVKVRRQVTLDDGTVAWLQLARGTVLRPGDRLRTAQGDCCRVVAQPEPVLTVRSPDRLSLLQAAYHLGNRHAPLEIAIDYLRLAPDPTLKDLLERRGLQVIEEIAPFLPDPGAYATVDRAHHAHNHHHDHAHSHHHE